MKNEQEAQIMLMQFRAQGMRAFAAMCKAAGKPNNVQANREYFAMGYATAKTEVWKTKEIGSWLHRMQVKTARFFVRVFTGHGPKALALFLLTAAATHERPECPKQIVSNILACDLD